MTTEVVGTSVGFLARPVGVAEIKNGVAMKKTARRVAVLAGLALTAAGVVVTPAAVASPTDVTAVRGQQRTVHVRGQQVPVDAANGEYVMRGDLVGEWLYIPRTPPLHSSDTLYVEAGTEVFKGCIDRNHDGRCGAADHRGELYLAFLYWAHYDLDGNLIRGQCTHPITGGRGAFVGARGLIDMVDRPVGNEVRTTYRGEIILDAVPSEGPARATTNGSTSDLRTTAAPMRRAC